MCSKKPDPSHPSRPIEESFRVFAESLSDLVWSARTDGHVDYHNRRFLDYLGITPDQIEGRDWAEALHPDDVGQTRRAWEEACSTGGAYEVESRIRRHDGVYRWHRAHASPIRDEPGPIARWFGTCTDIDDRHRSEERQREGERRYRQIVETANEGISDRRRAEEHLALQTRVLESMTEGVSVSDEGGTIVYTNPAEDRIFGYGPGELVGRHVSAQNAYPPEENARIVARVIDQLKAQGWWSGEWHNRKKDGTPFWTSARITAIERDGRRFWVCVQEDITERKRAESALRDSEAQFRAIYDQASVGIAEVDLSGRYLRANDRYCEIVGYSPGELLGLRFREITHPDDPPAHRERFARIAEGPSSYTIEKRYVRKDGRVVWASTAVSLIRDASGRPDRVVAVVEDVTERVRLEAELRGRVEELAGADRLKGELLASLREGEERIRDLMEQAPFSIQIFDPDGTTLRVNRAWEELWGVTLDQIADYNILRDQQLKAKGVLDPIRRAFAGEPAAVPAIQYDPNETIPDRTRHKDPRRWVAAVAYPLKDAAGRIREVVLVHDDITVRMKAEEALRAAHRELESRVAERTSELSRANEFLRALLESIQDGIVACDAEGVLTLFNRATQEFHGLPPEPLPADRWAEHYDLYRADGATRLTREEVPLFRALRGERVQGVEIVIAPGRGPARTLLASGQAFQDHQGRTLGAVMSMHDITARKQAEAALRAAHEDLERRVAGRTAELARANEALRGADRRKDEFLATLAHELRNPLAPIRNAARLLAGSPGVVAEAGGEVEMIGRQTAHLARLVDDLMDVARINESKIELRRDVVELASIVGHAVEAVRPAAQARGHQLVVRRPDGPIRLEADPTRLEQVLGNLLTNAIKYTEAGGRITLEVGRDGDEAVILVRDTGIGIPPEKLPEVFELFAQVDHRSARAEGGLGIGLGLARSLVEMHGGSIAARSDGPGAGSEFEVRLPALPVARADRAGPRRDQGRVGGPSLPRRRILVVDDNADAAQSLAKLLSRLYGQEVRVAHDGPEALAILGAFRPEVVLLDIGMPGMDGHEVARAIRARPRGGEVVIAALTGWGQEGDRRRSREAGIDHHLVKPVDPDLLERFLAEIRPRPSTPSNQATS